MSVAELWPGIRRREDGSIAFSCHKDERERCGAEPTRIYHFKSSLVDKQVVALSCERHRLAEYARKAEVRFLVDCIIGAGTGIDYSEARGSTEIGEGLFRCKRCNSILVNYTGNKATLFSVAGDEYCHRCEETKRIEGAPSELALRDLERRIGAAERLINELKCKETGALEDTLKQDRKQNEDRMNQLAVSISAQKKSLDVMCGEVGLLKADLESEMQAGLDDEEKMAALAEDVSRLKSIQQGTERKDTKTMNVKNEAQEAAVRTAASQFVKGLRVPLARALSKGSADESAQAKIADALDSPLGDAIVSLLLGVGLEHLPLPIGSGVQGVVRQLSAELRVRGASIAADQAADLVMGPLREALGGLLAGEAAEALQGLPVPVNAISTTEAAVKHEAPLRIVMDGGK